MEIWLVDLIFYTMGDEVMRQYASDNLFTCSRDGFSHENAMFPLWKLTEARKQKMQKQSKKKNMKKIENHPRVLEYCSSVLKSLRDNFFETVWLAIVRKRLWRTGSFEDFPYLSASSFQQGMSSLTKYSRIPKLLH